MIKTNGHTSIDDNKELPLFPLPLLEEEDDMSSRRSHSDELASVTEQLQILSLRQAERDRASTEQASKQTEILMRLVEKLDNNKDKTALPNWLMPLICTAFIGLVVYA